MIDLVAAVVPNLPLSVPLDMNITPHDNGLPGSRSRARSWAR